ncbi:hypothetical protein K0W35_004822 [Vibrio parahaemolyticus]|nr:hypothetical protein [Vibrio parahaemolyticus]
MHFSPQESIEQLQFELNDTKGRLDALSFMARLDYNQEHLATLGEVGEE